jgi:hypothetical protein
MPGKALKPLLAEDGTVVGAEVRLPDGSVKKIHSEVLLDWSRARARA